jgi:fatty-acyl-CoA synthase
MNLWDALTCKERGAGRLHCWEGTGFHTASWPEVVGDARRIARGLRARGVRPGSRVASVLTNSPRSVRGVLGVWLAGGTLASLPVPARGMDVEEYRGQLRTLCDHVEPCVFVLDQQLRELVPDPLPGGAKLHSWESLEAPDALDPSPPELDEVAFVQYSSGSTGRPRGCKLTARAIAAQLELLRAAVEGEPGREVVCSWLPLSHDMGLFGCVLYPWAWDYDLALSSPERFMHSPRTWFADMARWGCTESAGTSSALHFAARAQRGARLAERLRLRTVVIGAERIEPEALAAAVETFAPFGLRPHALRPAYGLAEATLAVTATPTDQAPSVRRVDAVALADGEIEEVEPDTQNATALVSLGGALEGVELRFEEPERLSQLHVRSPSIFSGYHADPEATAERLRDGEVATRDLGFLHHGELYLVGRSDDILSIGGRKVYAHEIEAAVGSSSGVRRGCCTIIDVPGSGATHLTMLLELRDGRTDFEEIAAAAARTATAKAGINLSECVFLEKGALPKTPTGKIQRYRCRELLLRDSLSPIRRVWMAGGSGARPGAPRAGVPEPGAPRAGVPEPGAPRPGVPEPGVPRPRATAGA